MHGCPWAQMLGTSQQAARVPREAGGTPGEPREGTRGCWGGWEATAPPSVEPGAEPDPPPFPAVRSTVRGQPGAQTQEPPEGPRGGQTPGAPSRGRRAANVQRAAERAGLGARPQPGDRRASCSWHFWKQRRLGGLWGQGRPGARWRRKTPRSPWPPPLSLTDLPSPRSVSEPHPPSQRLPAPPPAAGPVAAG